MDNTPKDPRIAKATSINADNDDKAEGDKTEEPKTLKITSASSDPEMFELPWNLSLIDWPEDLFVNLPRGISRHVVRFVRVGTHVYAMKEITRPVAEKEYETLRQLEKLEIPAVKPIAVVTGRHNDQGEELEAMLVTEHLKFSLPYRALFARKIRTDTAQRLINALAVLMVRLHLIGFYWGDVSLSNVLFLRDADAFTAFLVDAETGELYAKLTDGQREYDMDLARTNIIGELMDLNSGNLLPSGVDEITVGNSLVDSYHQLWSALTDVSIYKQGEMWKIEKRVEYLNSLGFDVDELEVTATPDGNQMRVRPRVVDAGYASRQLRELTGLDVQENQARRLLNDIDAYKVSTWRQDEDRKAVATDWMRDEFEPIVKMIPEEYKSRIQPAQFFHEVLTHRWYLGEKIGRDVPLEEAARSYIDEHLKDYRIDTQVMKAINADADAGVIDDEGTYGSNADIVEEGLDDSVWSQDLSDKVNEKLAQEGKLNLVEESAGDADSAGDSGSVESGSVESGSVGSGSVGSGRAVAPEAVSEPETQMPEAGDMPAQTPPSAAGGAQALGMQTPTGTGTRSVIHGNISEMARLTNSSHLADLVTPPAASDTPSEASAAPLNTPAAPAQASEAVPASAASDGESAVSDDSGVAPVTMLSVPAPVQSAAAQRQAELPKPVESAAEAPSTVPSARPVRGASSPADVMSASVAPSAPPVAVQGVPSVPPDAPDAIPVAPSAPPQAVPAARGEDTAGSAGSADMEDTEVGVNTEVIYPLPDSKAVLTVEPLSSIPTEKPAEPGTIVGTAVAGKDEKFAPFRAGREYAPRVEQPVIIPPAGPTTPPEAIREAGRIAKATPAPAKREVTSQGDAPEQK